MHFTKAIHALSILFLNEYAQWYVAPEHVDFEEYVLPVSSLPRVVAYHRQRNNLS
jgi:hypothetical protein